MPLRPPVHRPPHQKPKSVATTHGFQGSPSRLGMYDHNWRKLRAAFVASNPICLFCLNEGRVTPTQEVDHIKTVLEHPELRLVWANLRPLCKSHHSQRTADYLRGIDR